MTDLKKFMMSRMELILFQGIQNYLDFINQDLDTRYRKSMATPVLKKNIRSSEKMI